MNFFFAIISFISNISALLTWRYRNCTPPRASSFAQISILVIEKVAACSVNFVGSTFQVSLSDGHKRAESQNEFLHARKQSYGLVEADSN